MGGSSPGARAPPPPGKGQKRARLSPAKVRGAETMDDLAGRMAVVTGGGSGLGRSLAIACARRGMRVLLADVDEDSLGATAALLALPYTLRLRVDVSRPDEVAGLAELAYREAPDVALLFNNAGVASGGWIWETTPEDWQWLIGVNLMGVVHGVQSFVPRMIRQGRPAHIVNTSSAAGLLSVPAGSAYCATKHGVVTLSECLHHELKMKGAPIGVSVLCPSFVQTGIAESERHRPRELRRPGRPFAPRDENQERAMRDAPLTADEVAEITLAHVLRGSFYVLPASDPAGVYSPANYVDASCNLVSRYDWNTRKIRVQAEATENVGEIDAACLDANTHLACSRLRIGGFFDSKDLGRA